jgi:glycosyltransferase involved in cell wall biosynthesis
MEMKQQTTPLRILQVISSSATSGAERHVFNLTTMLRDRGHEVRTICPEPGWLPEVLRDAHLPVTTSMMRGTGWYRTMLLIAREIRRHKIDVVHTHLTRAAYIGYSACRLARKPIVHSVHIANNDMIYKRLARRKNRLVAVSNYVAGMLHGQGIQERFVDTVYNGTDFNLIARQKTDTVKAEFGIPSERRLIGLVGRVCRLKGHIEMIDAMRLLKSEHPDAHLMLVGRVEQQFQEELESAVAEAGISDRLTMTGIRHDVARLIDSFTLSTMPSHMETFGIAAVEAMARGKAVVASKAGGLPEVVKHRQTGLLVDLRPEPLAEAVSYLMSHDREREEMGQMGRRLVEEKFSLQEMLRQFERVYESATS